MPKSLRLLCLLHNLLGVLNALWTAFFAWVLGQSMWQLAPRPWAGFNSWDRLFFITGPLLLVAGVTGVVLNFHAPIWIARREQLSTCRGLSILNLVPLFSFFGFGLPVALYALWIYRRENVRAWSEPSLTAVQAEDPLPELPRLEASEPAFAATAPTPRRRTTHLLAAAER